MLNRERIAAMAVTFVWFWQTVDRRLMPRAAANIPGAGAVMGWVIVPGPFGPQPHVCAGGIGNKLPRRRSDADPVQIAMVKGSATGVLI